jgi:hypothetical protein
MHTEPHPLRVFGSLIINYFRWSQLTPMILMWFSLLGMLFLLFFVNNQEATWSATENVAEWIASLPLVGPWFTDWMAAQAEDGSLDATDLKSAALSAWAVLSLVFMVISWTAGALFGPFKPWTLKLKLGLSAIAGMLFAAAFVGFFYINPELSNDPFGKILSTGIGMGVLAFIVSTWCLSIAHILGRVSDAVAGVDLGHSKPSDGHS